MASNTPYDAKVAGVVSGAGRPSAGIKLGQECVASGDTLVAMTGVAMRNHCHPKLILLLLSMLFVPTPAAGDDDRLRPGFQAAFEDVGRCADEDAK